MTNDRRLVVSYRTVSLLNVASKVLESALASACIINLLAFYFNNSTILQKQIVFENFTFLQRA